MISIQILLYYSLNFYIALKLFKIKIVLKEYIEKETAVNLVGSTWKILQYKTYIVLEK